MACLINNSSNLRYYLSALHTFGRSESSVQTCIDSPEISRIHAIIEWDGRHWCIRDVSKNGTWLNKQRLVENRPVRLNTGDSICFSGEKSHCFTVDDLERPVSMLTALDQTPEISNATIRLEYYSILPSKKNPELAIYFDDTMSCWMQEPLKDRLGDATVLHDRGICHFANRNWRFVEHHEEVRTARAAANSLHPHTLKYIFKMSRDEERTQIELVAPNKKIDLKFRAHHYLTLNLARQRARDASEGFEKDEQGWIYTDQLSRDLGLDILHINIHIHRARKQFADMLDHLIQPDFLIERQPGRIRFGGECFEIYKGQDLIQAMRSTSAVAAMQAG